MHYYIQQQLLTAVRLMLNELDKDKPDMSSIAELMSERSEMIDGEIEDGQRMG